MKLVRWARGALVGLALMFSVGCAGAQANSATRVASGLEATKDLYRAACTHEPIAVPADVCEAGKDGINAVIDRYSTLNDALPAGDE